MTDAQSRVESLGKSIAYIESRLADMRAELIVAKVEAARPLFRVGQVVYWAGDANEPRFITRSSNGAIHLISSNGSSANAFKCLADITNPHATRELYTAEPTKGEPR